MHICFFINEYPFWSSGGVGTFVQTIGKKLVANGDKVSVLVMDGSAKDFQVDDEGVKVYRLATSKWKYAKFIPNSIRVHQKIRELQSITPIDILETTEGGLTFFSRNTSYKKVIRMHGGHHYLSILFGKKMSKWKGFKEKLSLQKADFICAVSETVAKYTKDYANLNKDITVIYNPVDVNLFGRSNGAPVQNRKIVFIGSVYDKKGVIELVQSMPEVIETFPDAQLYLYGRDIKIKDKPTTYIQYLKELLDKKWYANIHFMGEVKHSSIPQILQEAEFCVLPSKIEAMPIAWLEVMASGKPLIGGDIPSGREVINPGHNGLLVNPDDPKDIAAKIIYLLKNPEIAAQLGTQAKKDVAVKFSLDKIIDDNMAFYSSCLTKK
jgi:glycosyltransferase involved in cell wall biosynthesis